MSLIRCHCETTWDSDEHEDCPRCEAIDADVVLAEAMLGDDIEAPPTRADAHVLEVRS